MKPRRLMISLPSRPMRPSSVTSGMRLTKRTVYLSTASTFSSDGQMRLATAGTSGGSFLPSTLSRASTVVNSVLFERDVVVRAEHALAAEGEDHVVGGHLVAIVEFHALAQRELDGALVDALPALGQARHRLELALQVLRDQVLEDRRLHALADVGLLAHGLERGAGRDLLDGDGDGRPVSAWPMAKRGKQEAAGGEASGREKSPTIQARHAFLPRQAAIPSLLGKSSGLSKDSVKQRGPQARARIHTPYVG